MVAKGISGAKIFSECAQKYKKLYNFQYRAFFDILKIRNSELGVLWFS